MKIADKITVLVLFLIGAIACNAFIAMGQVSFIGQQLREVTDKDNVLTDVCNTITRNYLENAIRFQALLNAGDELAFSQMPESRRQYLISYLTQIKDRFARLTQATGAEIIRGKELIQHAMDRSQGTIADQEELRSAAELLRRIESTYIAYDGLFNEIYAMISAGQYQLSLEDLSRVHQKEKILSEKISSLLEETRRSTQRTLNRAAQEEARAHQNILWGLVILIVITGITSILIIRSFSYPLKNLMIAAKEIAKRNFNVKVQVRRADEVGEVGSAFNLMTTELQAFKNQLEEQNQVLVQNLEITKNQKLSLEKANKELDQFAHTVSHDIAQPLTGIVAYSAILEENYAEKLDDRAQRSIVGIHKSAKRLSAMINDLLTLSRISRLKNPYEKVDSQKVFDEAKARLDYAIAHSQAQVTLAGSLPELFCDRIKLTEIFYNLLSNAVKFSSLNKSQSPKIEVGYLAESPWHKFYVKDNGVGIAPEHREEIFEIFKRLESSAELEGTGTGLSIVKAAVEDHGGAIWVESHLGDGATFYFTIPQNLQTSYQSKGVS